MMMCDAVLTNAQPGKPLNRSQVTIRMNVIRCWCLQHFSWTAGTLSSAQQLSGWFSAREQQECPSKGNRAPWPWLEQYTSDVCNRRSRESIRCLKVVRCMPTTHCTSCAPPQCLFRSENVSRENQLCRSNSTFATPLWCIQTHSIPPCSNSCLGAFEITMHHERVHHPPFSRPSPIPSPPLWHARASLERLAGAIQVLAELVMLQKGSRVYMGHDMATAA